MALASAALASIAFASMALASIAFASIALASLASLAIGYSTTASLAVVSSAFLHAVIDMLMATAAAPIKSLRIVPSLLLGFIP